jgi:hypothetical protein
LFLISSVSEVSAVLHVVDWQLYITQNRNAPTLQPYTTYIAPPLTLTSPSFSISEQQWIPITDSAEIALLSKSETEKTEPTVNLYAASGKQSIEVSIFPVKIEDDKILRLHSFIVTIVQGEAISAKSEKVYRNQSILSSGKWVKLSSVKSGIHKLSYARLTELGISNPSNVAIYSNGGYMLPKMNNVEYYDDLMQLPVIHSKDKSDANCVFFYSPGTTQWSFNNSEGRFSHEINLYTDSVFFYVSSDVAASPSPFTVEPLTALPDTTLTTFTNYGYYEKENYSIINSGRLWFSDKLMNGYTKTYTFDFPKPITSKSAKITLVTAARCFQPPSMEVKINNSQSYTINYPYTSSYEYGTWAQTDNSTWNVPAKSTTTIDIRYNTNGLDGEAWLDYLSLNVPSELEFNGSQLPFRNEEIVEYNTAEFRVSAATPSSIIWNITDPLHPKRISVAFSPETKIVSFTCPGGTIDEYLIFDPLNGNFTEPSFLTTVKNQNIHGLPSYEMVVITHPNFLKPATTLAEFHRQFDNMSVLVVTTEEIYNEFSSGMPDVSAIRNMLRMFYDKGKNSGTPLKYALLLGDGSFNNRMLNNQNFNFIPTYQSVNSINKGRSFVTDDFFGLLDENEGETTGLLDIGIGRIPCKNEYEAETVVTKIMEYTQPKTFGDWRNVVCFLADDEDGNQFMQQAEELNSLINENYPGFFTKKIYFDSYQQLSTSGGFKYPDATEAINQRVNEGALILNYIGHGNPLAMAHENVLLINDINAWKNSNSLPLFITATCEFGRFDGEKDSGGESILLNPSGGGIALFTTTRVVSAWGNQDLSKNFYRNIFSHDESGEKLRLGDVMKNAKNLTNDTNKHSFTLLADPALRLAFPKYVVNTKTVNGVNIDTSEVQIGALDKVTIKGEVTSVTGEILSNYSGSVTTTVYDKEQTIETLANDGGTPFVFPVQNNIIYKGVSSVINGEFELSFIVPKDISYNSGNGKIIYYTSDGNSDGNGAVTNFNIGGSSKNPVIDNKAPEIEMFMNNEDFKPYGKVSSSALLLVNLFDDSGINTVGTGIGHDLVAVLDDDFSKPIVLNNFYSSVADSYQRGKIIYPFSGLEPGEHKIWIRIWDVQNNSSEKEVYFVVEDGFKVTSVTNFPNPVTSITDFMINHNLPGEVFDVNIDIFNTRGQKVNTLFGSYSSSRTTQLKVRWNVFQSDYPVYPNEWLIYRVILKDRNGLTATGAGKLLISTKN